jgi:hypothetical protein
MGLNDILTSILHSVPANSSYTEYDDVLFELSREVHKHLYYSAGTPT